MISSRIQELQERFTLLAKMFFSQEITSQEKSINSEKDYEKFIQAMLQIYMAPIIELSQSMISKVQELTYNPIKYQKYAIFIEETIARIYCELLDKLDIQSNRGRMGTLAGQTLAEIIECTLEMEKIGREYRLKPPIIFPLKNIESDQIQFCFPSKEKPIHLVIVKDKKATEYYIEEIEMPKYKWVKRTAEKKEYLNEFTIEWPLGGKI